ncbi:MAG: hypothetical protein LLF94_11595 [Chlamydiales bacterium]|nr:hypothetical protein [Chlamydiales bacterium]
MQAINALRDYVSGIYNSKPDETKVVKTGKLKSIDGTSIPVIDMTLFQTDKPLFIQKVSSALQDIGFFALINTGLDQGVLDASYKASEQFFKAPEDKQAEIHEPKVHGQRGLVYSERAQGAEVFDKKVFVHIGKKEVANKVDNIWPTWMDLETPMMSLIDELDKISMVLLRAIALDMGEKEDFLTEQAEFGDNLLRALYYPKNPEAKSMGAAPHTDICDITLLPMSTADGLQVLHTDKETGKSKWIPVTNLPAGAVIVNGGDKLQNLTNGFFKSSWHQVKMDPNQERRSIVYFVHPRPKDSRSPTAKCIERTGGVQSYPDANSEELLFCRLRELKLLKVKELLDPLDAPGGIMERITKLVEAKVASRPTQRTWLLWDRERQKAQAQAEVDAR